jgi:hypothetical protein
MAGTWAGASLESSNSITIPLPQLRHAIGDRTDTMAKPKRSQEAVMALRMDSSTPEAPREVQPPADSGFQTPCTLTGVMAGLSGGSLGYVFGFGEWQGRAAVTASGFEPQSGFEPCRRSRRTSRCRQQLPLTTAHCLPGCARFTPAGGYWMRMRRSGQWKASLAEGWGSAKVRRQGSAGLLPLPTGQQSQHTRPRAAAALTKLAGR